ncbi:glycosyltransferase family 2 protein [Falsiroseomonas sp.]|uniref:glycosyltransferase family 2 protein n=1 Tax=Falsiroseomonas sp. TaxID=2870721 RepID=UPI003566BA04
MARNEALRLPDALAAARRLGVNRVIVVDNGSRDATRAIALAAGAHLVLAEEPYAAAGFGVTWTNALLDAYGRGHWALVLDADEQLVFPGSDRVGLQELTAHLEALGSEALRTVMLDCFPPGPLARCAYRAGTSLAATACLFEPPSLRQERIIGFPGTLDYGGIRERLFFPEADPRRPLGWLHRRLFNLGLRLPWLRGSAGFARLAPPRSPTLTKIPLLRWREGAALLASTHRTAPMAMAAEQPTGVLLHFKFLQDFHARARDAVARNAHWDASREYRRYLARMEADPNFALDGMRSRRYAGPDQLVACGLMRDTPGWRLARGAE